MGRKGGKKYRKELRKEQSERDKDALFWKLGKQVQYTHIYIDIYMFIYLFIYFNIYL